MFLLVLNTILLITRIWRYENSILFLSLKAIFYFVSCIYIFAIFVPHSVLIKAIIVDFFPFYRYGLNFWQWLYLWLSQCTLRKLNKKYFNVTLWHHYQTFECIHNFRKILKIICLFQDCYSSRQQSINSILKRKSIPQELLM